MDLPTFLETEALDFNDLHAVWMNLPLDTQGTCLWMNRTQMYFSSRSVRHSSLLMHLPLDTRATCLAMNLPLDTRGTCLGMALTQMCASRPSFPTLFTVHLTLRVTNGRCPFTLVLDVS